MIFKEDYKAMCMQEDMSEKELDVWEGAGLKEAIESGKKPSWGLYFGGTKYNLTQYDAAFEDGNNTFRVLFAQATKKGVVVIATDSQIIAGFYSEEQGQNPGNCKKAVLAFA